MDTFKSVFFKPDPKEQVGLASIEQKVALTQRRSGNATPLSEKAVDRLIARFRIRPWHDAKPKHKFERTFGERRRTLRSESKPCSQCDNSPKSRLVSARALIG